MADKLTPQQALAVNNRGGNLLVSAAAGSGKTKVLVDRLMGYLTDEKNPADLDEFLIITYTKAAASELRGKIGEKLSQMIAADPENVHLQKQMQRLFLTKISTVHGFCSDILKEYAYKLDISPDYRVADESECTEIRSVVLEELLDDAYRSAQEGSDFRAFVDTQGLGRDDRLVPEIIERVYNSAMCHLSPEGWLERCVEYVDLDGVSDASETVWGKVVMDDLFAYLDKQIEAISFCVNAAEEAAGLEKVAANLADTVFQLKKLRSCATWDDLVKKSEISYARLSFPRKDPDPALSEKIKAVRNACKKGLEKKLRVFSDSSEQVLYDLTRSASATRGLIELVRAFWKRYALAKKSRRALDFSDLEHKTLDLLLGKSRSGITSSAREIGSRFREIMVDEYQDSNGVQDAIFEALTRARRNCFMVGDVKQSIYQFRLADPSIFLEKYKTYTPAEAAEDGQGRKVLLSHNFRSGPEVIEAVNDVFSSCMRPELGGLWYTEAEALREGIPHKRLPDPGVQLNVLDIREDTYLEEAAFTAERIADMLREGTLIRSGDSFRPVMPEDIVILLRSPGSVGASYKQALEGKGIRCSMGTGADLLHTEEIATLRSLLQIIVNPRQDIPLVSVLVSPVFGFTADDLSILRGSNKKGSVYDALLAWNNPKADYFRKILEALRRESRVRSLTKLIEECICLTRMDSIFFAMAEGAVRRNNLQMFFKLASDQEVGQPRDLIQFLRHLDVLEDRGIPDSSGSTAGAVTIMSIHKSKGLEFPVVFICGLAREFNRESLRAPILCSQKLGIGLSVVDTENRIRYPSLSKRAIALEMQKESISEEMRVLYVALTRAKDRLIMICSPKNIEKSLKEISLRMDIDGGALFCAEASCPGDWVMAAAMGRTESAELFSLGGKPEKTRVKEIPWDVRIESAPENTTQEALEESSGMNLPEQSVNAIRCALEFRYPFEGATRAPSKQTATGIKGRIKDREAAENTVHSRQGDYRRPTFRSGGDSAVYGTLVHKVMQYLNFVKCGSKAEIQEQIAEMTGRGFLSPEDAVRLNVDDLSRFFESAYGKLLCSGAECLREYKFSILDDGLKYSDDLSGEKVLLQGVVDCAILEPDGITVIDFKTDAVSNDSLGKTIEKYRSQICAYSDALGRIFEMPVKNRVLYFFRLGKGISV